ncbi:inheritance of peroxisomes protein 1-domain-containing protein [Xylariaceae sp. FL0804]|nr:inheritance of peroxisomes protein 1-domain-containing protein [Xylariaceae sp. FL0804]
MDTPRFADGRPETLRPRRVATEPLSRPKPGQRPNSPSSPPSRPEDVVETLYNHPAVKIVAFTTNQRSSFGIAAENDTVPGTLPASSRLERTIAVGVFRIYRAPGSVAFLNCGSALQPILPKSQCWCIDEANSCFVLQIRRPQYWRIEVPVADPDDVQRALLLRDVLGKILLFEKTQCPFQRSFTVPLPEPPKTPVKKKAWTPVGKKLLSSPFTAELSPPAHLPKLITKESRASLRSKETPSAEDKSAPANERPHEPVQGEIEHGGKAKLSSSETTSEERKAAIASVDIPGAQSTADERPRESAQGGQEPDNEATRSSLETMSKEQRASIDSIDVPTAKSECVSVDERPAASAQGEPGQCNQPAPSSSVKIGNDGYFPAQPLSNQISSAAEECDPRLGNTHVSRLVEHCTSDRGQVSHPGASTASARAQTVVEKRVGDGNHTALPRPPLREPPATRAAVHSGTTANRDMGASPTNGLNKLSQEGSVFAHIADDAATQTIKATPSAVRDTHDHDENTGRGAHLDSAKEEVFGEDDTPSSFEGSGKVAPVNLAKKRVTRMLAGRSFTAPPQLTLVTSPPSKSNRQSVSKDSPPAQPQAAQVSPGSTDSFHSTESWHSPLSPPSPSSRPMTPSWENFPPPHDNIIVSRLHPDAAEYSDHAGTPNTTSTVVPNSARATMNSAGSSSPLTPESAESKDQLEGATKVGEPHESVHSSALDKRPEVRQRKRQNNNLSISRRALSPLPPAANLFHSPVTRSQQQQQQTRRQSSSTALVTAVRRLPSTIVQKTVEILLSPPSHLVSLMLKVAARIAAGEWRGLVLGFAPESGEHIPVQWDYYSDGDLSGDELTDDDDDGNDDVYTMTDTRCDGQKSSGRYSGSIPRAEADADADADNAGRGWEVD